MQILVVQFLFASRTVLFPSAGSESLEKAIERLDALESQLKVASAALEDGRTRFMKAKEELVGLRNKRNTLAQKEIEVRIPYTAVLAGSGLDVMGNEMRCDHPHRLHCRQRDWNKR